MQKRHFLQF